MPTTTSQTPETMTDARRPQAPTRTGPVLVAIGEGDVQPLFHAAGIVASRVGSGVHVVSVVRPLLLPDQGATPILMSTSLDAERELREAVADLVERQVREVTGDSRQWAWEVITGDPASVLSRRASTLGASMILMGLGHHRPIDRLLAAETTLRVVRHTSSPVLAIGESFDALPRNVVVATDFSARSALAAESVIPMLGENASLHLVHVWQRSGASHESVRAMEQRYEERLPARFERFRASLGLPDGVTVTTEVLEGTTVARLLEFAQSSHADLIVAGRQGLPLLARLAVGSVTTALIRAATCAVLVVPEPSFADYDRMQRWLTGMSETADPARWPEQLEAFTRRNTGRRADLEVDDPALGAQSQERGYVFLGASYDPHDRRISLMLGGTGAGTAHLGRGIAHAESVAVLCDPHGRDIGLGIRHGQGQTLLLFANES